MSLMKDKIMDLLSVHGGMLLSQLYRQYCKDLPQEQCVSYSTFTRYVNSIVAVKSSRLFPNSPNKFVCVSSKMSTHKKRELVLVSEYEYSYSSKTWYCDLSGVSAKYLYLEKCFPSALKLGQNSVHTTHYLANPASAGDKPSSDLKTPKTYAPLLVGLVRRGWFPLVKKDNAGELGLVWICLDGANRIYTSEYRADFALICAFMSYHSIACPWSISIMTWSDDVSELYKSSFKTPEKYRIDNYDYNIQFGIGVGANANKSQYLSTFRGLNCLSMNVAKQFNAVALDRGA